MTTYVTQPSNMPTRKVTWATLSAIGASIMADIVVNTIPQMGMVDPAELELLLEAIIIGLATFIGGWLPKERA